MFHHLPPTFVSVPSQISGKSKMSCCLRKCMVVTLGLLRFLAHEVGSPCLVWLQSKALRAFGQGWIETNGLEPKKPGLRIQIWKPFSSRTLLHAVMVKLNLFAMLC